MSPIFIVSLHRQSDKTSSERHQKVNNKFNNKKIKKGNKLWQRM